MGIMVDSPVWVMQDLSHCHYQQGRAESGLCGYLSSIFFLGLSSALRPHALGLVLKDNGPCLAFPRFSS